MAMVRRHYEYTFDDEVLIKRFENFMSTISEDVFDIDRTPIERPIVADIVNNPSNVEAIMEANFINDQVTYVNTKRVYDKDGNVLGESSHASPKQMLLSTQFFADLRDKYPTTTWALIMGRIKVFKQIKPILDNANNALSYNTVYYTLLPDLNK